ncbi:MAG: hypothetical protein Q9201_007865 [Fulgogasparrea decipioides]
MHSVQRALFFLIFTLSHAAILRQADVTAGAITLTQVNHSSTFPLDSNLRDAKVATVQLVNHEDFMRIVYEDSLRIPIPLYRSLLQTTMIRIAYQIIALGEDAIVVDQFVNREGNILLTAQSNQHSPTKELTWSILGEAIDVLNEFTLRRPFMLTGEIMEGLNGKGPPIGDVAIFVRNRLPAAQTSND